MRRITLAVVATLVASMSLHAQSPYLVKDVNSTTTASPLSSTPNNFFRFGSRIVFAASTPAFGSELWSTDGTEAGTTQVADINAGPGSSSPSHFAVLNGKLLFNATDPRSGTELWTSDGTAAGTRLLADIRLGTASSSPGDRIVFGDKMIFAADDGVHGNELWVTDGTSAGIRLLKDLFPGPVGTDPSEFVLFHGAVYFCASNGLWKSDGTEAGTVQVKEGYAYSLVVAGSQMFFGSQNDATGDELWVSDGTPAGTRMVPEINPGRAPSIAFRAPLTAFGDRVLFNGVESQHGVELWISDGTAAGTHLVRDIAAGTASSRPGPHAVTDGGVAFFTATTEGSGEELWKTDGTEGGTLPVTDIVPGRASGGINSIVARGNRIYFIAAGGLWTADGITGTKPVQASDAVVALGSSGLTIIDGILYFAGANHLNGYEPWKSDGTAEGTSMIGDLARDAAPSSNPSSLTAAGDWVYFTAWDGTPLATSPNSIWRSDGTAEGTLRLGNFFAENLRTAGHSLYFTRSNVGWTSDGTPEGTVPFVSKNVSGQASVAFANGGTLFINGTDGLYVVSQTANAVPEPLGGVTGSRFINQAGRTFFIAKGAVWSSDGTRAGTYAAGPAFSEDIIAMASMGGSIYYVTRSANGTTKLWRNDGTFESNVLVKSLAAYDAVLAAGERRLFFLSGGQLWVSDGNEAGTQVLISGAAYLSTLAVAGNRAIFAANDPANGTEPWVSDGTVAGTHLLRDISPGTLGSFPSDLTSVRGFVYFSAADDLHGNEVWVTDGTPEGTKLAADVEPGPTASFPHQYVEAGGRLFFTATTTATGNELWALPLPTALRLTVNDIGIAEGDSVSTTARFTVTLSAPSTQPVTVDYVTSDGTATSGSDYDAASGTLTFAAGETSKTIDVRVLGDLSPEANETFFLTLRNPAGAALQNASAVAIIDDDDQVADLGLSLDFSSLTSLDVTVNATNNGPRTATNIRVAHTITPADYSGPCQFGCISTPALLAAGATEKVFQYRGSGFQQYLTTTATIRERDTQPSNNSVGWVTNAYVAMDALFLTPGSQANVWFIAYNATSVIITSSDSSVLSVPSTLAVTGGQPATFVARGVSVGTATIRISTPSGIAGTLTIVVVPSGTTPRWPGAILAFPGTGGVPFDSPLLFSIVTGATAPYTGAKPTGIVTVSANGHELGRVPLDPDVNWQDMNYYLPDFGNNTIRFDYSGDANFLPMSTTASVQATTGRATILGGAERIGTAARVHVRVAGSPSGAPTGSITISEPGVIAAKTVTLTPGAPGESQADIDLTNVSAAPHTLVVTYAGDARYAPSSQSIRMTDARLRSAKH